MKSKIEDLKICENKGIKHLFYKLRFKNKLKLHSCELVQNGVKF